MLHDVGYVNIIAIDSGRGQGFIQNSACRPYKRTALQVFFVARLFAHQHDPSDCVSFTEDGLRAQLP